MVIACVGFVRESLRTKGVHEMVKIGDGGAMIWDCMIVEGHGMMCMIERIMG